MVTQRTQLNAFLGLLFLTLILTVMVYLPFIQVIIIASVTAVLLSSFYRRALNLLRGREGVAATITCLVLVTMIVVPLLLIGTKVAEETSTLYHRVTEQKDGFLIGLQDTVDGFTEKMLPGITIKVDDGLKKILSIMSNSLGSIFSGLITVLSGIVLWIIATFYMLKDGHRFVDRFIELSPLTDDYDHVIVNRMELAIHSVVRGQLLVATLQGALTGIGFAILGIPQAALWGVVAAFCALIPGVGTGLVIAPGIIYLFATGNTIEAIILTMWGGLAVGVIDNVLGPSLIGKGANIHPMLVLFAVLGGITVFGPLGFILGPLSVSLLIALLDIYRILILKEKKQATLKGSS